MQGDLFLCQVTVWSSTKTGNSSRTPFLQQNPLHPMQLCQTMANKPENKGISKCLYFFLFASPNLREIVVPQSQFKTAQTEFKELFFLQTINTVVYQFWVVTHPHLCLSSLTAQQQQLQKNSEDLTYSMSPIKCLSLTVCGPCTKANALRTQTNARQCIQDNNND